eukprot:2171882-Karenia_brevis.AAC.1
MPQSSGLLNGANEVMQQSSSRANGTNKIMSQFLESHGANLILPQSSSGADGTIGVLPLCGGPRRDGDMCFWIQCIR